MDTLLVINAGSSSLKFQLYALAGSEGLELMYRGQVSGIGGGQPELAIRDGNGVKVVQNMLPLEQARDLASAQASLGEWLAGKLEKAPRAVGHRIVHGGPRLSDSVKVDDGILAYLDSLAPLAPLHQHNNLAPVHVIHQRWPDIVQVACFDTAFHRSNDAVVERFAIPQSFYDRGVRRYGFHGLSYDYISRYLSRNMPEVWQGRVIAAHMGSGVSACAMLRGVSVETTMGFTALDGLPMSTRPGRMDPGVVLWMLEQGMSHDEIQDVLYNQSGLKGLSGISGDVRDLLSSDQPSARLALDHFTYRAAESMAGLCVASGGVDALVFTAGVGENQPWVREQVCRRLTWLGVELDDALNQRGALRISSGTSSVAVFVIPTNEEYVIARETLRHL